jgi:small subunit ribosomal protein S4e
MLDKLTGKFAPRPSTGPHKLRECIPVVLLIRNRLKFATTYQEAKVIMKNRSIKIDGKTRTDMRYPCGYQDVLSIEKIDKHFRLLHDTKGRFILNKISPQEATYKLCRVKKISTGNRGIPYLVTHDNRTIRFPDPLIKPSDTVKVDLATNKIVEFIKFEVGNTCAITAGHNIGRVGVIKHTEKHPGSHNIVHVEDKTGSTWATRQGNVFVIGEAGSEPAIKLPNSRGYNKGIKLSIIEEASRRAQYAAQQKK